MTASFLSSLDSREEAPATISSECTLRCALFMRLLRVLTFPLNHSMRTRHRTAVETSTEHRTEHFLMGGSNCCITFQTHEFLFLFPVGGATVVTVARFLFFCPRASEQRVSHTKVVDLPCPLIRERCRGVIALAHHVRGSLRRSRTSKPRF